MTTAPHPVTVGNTFVKQYYNLLTEAPEKLHRFYKDASRFSHATGSQMEEPVTGQTSINAAIIQKNYTGTRVDLDNGSIDCHASLEGGVIVMVTGIIKLKNAQPTPFVQTFFLAVQTNGYYVLNDVLRFLEVGHHVAPASPAKKAAPAPSPSKATQTVVAAAKEQATNTAATPTNTPTHAKSPKPETPKKVVASPIKAVPASPKPTPASPVAKPTSPVAKPASPKKVVEAVPASPKPVETKPSPKAKHPKPHHTPKQAPVEEPVDASPSGPKSWASLFGKAATAVQAVAAIKPAAVASPAPAPASPRKKVEEPAAPAPAPTKHRFFSIHIKDLAPQTKPDDLRELFQAYGKVANVTITQRGFAFVDFYEPESVKNVFADPEAEFVLHDAVLHVTERKETRGSFREGGRGRGRAPHSGGRGAPNGANGRSDAPRSAPAAKDARKPAQGKPGRPAQTK